MLILGVDKNAQRMVQEIHRQFKTIPGLREGKSGVKPEYGKCIDIATSGSLRELIPAGLMSIIATLVVGFIGGPLAIGGFLLGNIVSGLLIALFMSKFRRTLGQLEKYIESGEEGGKGSEAHKAAVIGDTVGDPFKDTAGTFNQYADHCCIARFVAHVYAVCLVLNFPLIWQIRTDYMFSR